MGRLQRAIRWRVEWLQRTLDDARITVRSLLFVLWYRDALGVVVGARRVRLMQRVRITGPGTVRVGDGVTFGHRQSPSHHGAEIRIITMFDESELTLGANSSVNNNNSFVVVKSIRVGERVSTGHDCQFYDSDMHSIDPVGRRTLGARGARQRDVVIGENVMIGSQVTVGPGTEIGENSVVAMRSYVRGKAFPANFVIAGDPARAVGKIADLLARTNPTGVVTGGLEPSDPTGTEC